MEDIAPSLLKNIQEDFQRMFDKSTAISDLYAKVRDGTATYKEAHAFAIETGDILAKAYKNNLSSEILPDGKLYYNIAERVISPTLANNYDIITDVTKQIQTSLNKAAGIGIKTVKPDINQDNIDNIINKVASSDDYDTVAWMLDAPVKHFSQSIVDDSIKANAELHAKSGLYPLIIRKVSGGCCEWCKKMAGTYRYPEDVPGDVYRRHNNCQCTVEYDPKDGKIQNVHTKKWRNEDEVIKIDARKTIGLSDKKSKTKERIRRSKELTEKELSGMKLGDLRKLAEETAIEYYKSGLAGISFGSADVAKVAEKLAMNGSRTSLKKDILSMRKKLQNKK